MHLLDICTHLENYYINVYCSAALHNAAQGGNIDVTKFLVEHGANVKATNNKGKTPYDNAVKRRHEEVAEYLKEIHLTMKLNEDDISEEEKKLVVKVELIFDILNYVTYHSILQVFVSIVIKKWKHCHVEMLSGRKTSTCCYYR